MDEREQQRLGTWARVDWSNQPARRNGCSAVPGPSHVKRANPRQQQHDEEIPDGKQHDWCVWAVGCGFG